MIKPATFDFLKKLKNNNNKEWFDVNRPQYEKIKIEFQLFITELIQSISTFDASIKQLEAKNCVFRINRDVRFSKNKTPYKSNISASIAPGGKKSSAAGYYIHLQPGASYIAGGMWQPETPLIKAIRQEIDYNAVEFKNIINNKAFKKYFTKLSEQDKLISVPKGYSKEHPEIELLKHRSFIVVHSLADEKVFAKNVVKTVTQICENIYPLDKFLRKACD
ncbi:MAG: DUF2461 domain-containing protein [Bacteroidia bacterium]